MRLKEHIYRAIKPHFACHGVWHQARLPQNTQLNGPSPLFPNLKVLGQKGSGEEFLLFHRDMIRVFKWIIQHTPGPPFVYAPWQEFPPFLVNLFKQQLPPGYLQALQQEIDRLVEQGTADELGGFIEPIENFTDHPAQGVHGNVHWLINEYERGKVEPEANMGDFNVAHHNEHFWGLHGWIDEIFARWQRRHGGTPDQTPHPPGAGHVCPTVGDEPIPHLIIMREGTRLILKSVPPPTRRQRQRR